jgi:cathepsin F
VCINSFTCTQKDFDDFKTEYNKSYATLQENNRRFQIFCKNVAEAAKLNAQHTNTEFGVTKFSDLTKEEFKKFYLGTRVPEKLPKLPDGTKDLPTDIPNFFDWRVNASTNVITDVYNQEQCGSCWSFSATEVIESKWAISGKQLVSLSMQQMIDCDTFDGGCSGGWPYKAMNYIANAPGQMLFSDYPYTAQQGSCQFSPSNAVVSIKGYEDAGTGNENNMAAYLSSKGPISVCVDASKWSYYTGGVFPASSCTTFIDHAVVAVGYNLDGGYWIIRNSWGNNWGYGGYIYLQFGANACDVAAYAVSAVV